MEEERPMMRSMPHDAQAEMAVLSAMFLDQEAVAVAAEIFVLSVKLVSIEKLLGE